MNRKQLTESIMAGVKLAFRENKSLNEGFSQWREQNVPRIDYKKVNTVIDYISAAFGKLSDLKQLLNVLLVFHDEKSASWVTINKLSADDGLNTNSIKTLLNSGIVKFKNEYCKGDEDAFAVAIKEVYIKIVLNKQSHLYKYIVSTIDPGSNKIKNMPYITLVKAGDDDNIGLRFSIQTLLTECNEILEYFS